MDAGQPQLVLLTPVGRGAIATLLVEGPGALDAVASVFHPKSGGAINAMPPADRIRLGLLGQEPSEEVVVRVRPPQSVEIHSHGGLSALQRARQLLLAQGCHSVSWQEWIARHDDDPIRAAAHRVLADARTERTAAILLDQYQGALRGAINSVFAAIGRDDPESAAGLLRLLLARASLGRHLTTPWKVVVAGPPNAGKSSLVNTLVGYARAIVAPAAGTTRDVVSTLTAMEGWPIELSDTAGLHDIDLPLEQAGIALAKEQLSAADLVVLVFDVSQPWSEGDHILLSDWPDSLVVYNKADLPPHPMNRASTGIKVSALYGDGVEGLSRQIAARLAPTPPLPGAAVPFTAEMVMALEDSLSEVLAGNLREAKRILSNHLR